MKQKVRRVKRHWRKCGIFSLAKRWARTLQGHQAENVCHHSRTSNDRFMLPEEDSGSILRGLRRLRANGEATEPRALALQLSFSLQRKRNTVGLIGQPDGLGLEGPSISLTLQTEFQPSPGRVYKEGGEDRAKLSFHLPGTLCPGSKGSVTAATEVIYVSSKQPVLHAASSLNEGKLLIPAGPPLRSQHPAGHEITSHHFPALRWGCQIPSCHSSPRRS